MATVTLKTKGNMNFDFSDHYLGATLNISLLRTLRVPDVPDDRKYRSKLPPGIGYFETVTTESLGDKFPKDQPAGMVMPMFQSEAMWIRFSSSGIPFLVKIAAGGVNAITGEVWKEGPLFGVSEKQDYVVVPSQPWIDGFKTSEGVVRQFVAVPLGKGLTVEEQLRGEAKFGGLQIVVHPMKVDHYNTILQERKSKTFDFSHLDQLLGGDPGLRPKGLTFGGATSSFGDLRMGLGAGGQIEQRIEKDPYKPESWEPQKSASLFIHFVNTEGWLDLTGREMPHKPLTASDYTNYGGTWFDYYNETDVKVSPELEGVKSIGEFAHEAGLPTDTPLKVPQHQIVDLTPAKVLTQWGATEPKPKEPVQNEAKAGSAPVQGLT